MNLRSRSVVFAALVSLTATLANAAPPSAEHWVGTWAAAPFEQSNAPRQFRPPVTAPAAVPGAATAPNAPTAAVQAPPSAAAPAMAQGATPPAAAAPGAPAGPGGANPARRFNFTPPPIYGSSDMTLREIVHVSLGGSRVRVVLTNEFGAEALQIGAAQVAISKGAAPSTPSTRPPRG